MAIVQELNKEWFCDRFKEMGRGDNFSYEGLCALYDYFDEYSDETGEDFKLDVIAICCDWYEASEEELLREYCHEIEQYNEDNGGEIDPESLVIDFMNDNTFTIVLDNGNILYQAF